MPVQQVAVKFELEASDLPAKSRLVESECKCRTRETSAIRNLDEIP
jgi:hypothetical protein